MILITGGAYHGKRNYAKQMYPGIDFVDGISCLSLIHISEPTRRS